MLRHAALLLAALLAASTVQAEPMRIGAWVGGPADDPYPQPTAENVAAFQEMQDRKLDLVSYFALWGESWPTTRNYAEIARQNGSILVVTWMANGLNLDAILAGQGDAYMRKYASGIKAWGREIWLRPLHEANGNWYDWGIGKTGAGNTSAKCIAAWKHIVQIFRDSAVTNVRWVWTTNATNSGPGTSLMGHYPGDDWVDYNSIDGYNWGTAQSWSSWQSFEQVFTPAYTLLAQRAKPIFIAEFSSSEHGGDKAQWIRDMFAAIPVKFPRLMALMWFSQSKSAEADWAVNTTDAALQAWMQGIAAYPTTVASRPLLGASQPLALAARGEHLVLEQTRPGAVRIELLAPTGRHLETIDAGWRPAGRHEFPVGGSGAPRIVRAIGPDGTRSAILPPTR